MGIDEAEPILRRSGWLLCMDLHGTYYLKGAHRDIVGLTLEQVIEAATNLDREVS
jgi:hypothetical protein